MYTDLQELEPAEFKNKEGKWFSTVKGVATEWLDDGEAGNIDTREFSYQGIDEAGAVTVIDGGYTSWDCEEVQAGSCTDCYTRITTQSTGSYVHPTDISGKTIAEVYDVMQKYWFENPTHNLDDYKFHFYKYSSGYLGSACIPDDLDPDRVTVHNVNGYDAYYQQFNIHITLGIGTSQQTHYAFKTANDALAFLINTFPTANFTYGMSSTQTYNELQNACPTQNGCMLEACNDFNYGYYCGTLISESSCTGPRPRFDANDVLSFYTQYDSNNPNSNTLTHECVEIQDLTGAYPDKPTCEADTLSPCGDPCLLAPNVVTANSSHASAPGCNDGSINVEVYMAGNATSWTVSYEDASGNTIIDSATYTQNGNSNVTTNLPQGVYTAIVIDNLGCTEEVQFNIDCLSNPCSSVSPHDFKADILLNPAWDKNVNDCWRASSGVTFGSGEITISNNSLVAPALMWSVRVYSVINGISTMIFASNMLYPGASIAIDGLEEGDYEYEIIDDQPCSYPPKPFTLDCIPVVPCVPPMIPYYGWSTTDATSTDGCATSSHGTHEIISVNVTAPASTFTAQYYEISGPTWPAATATAIGPLQGPAQGNVSLTTPLGYYDLEAAPTTTTPGKFYAVVITDDEGCENVQTFTVDCIGTSPTSCTNATAPSASLASTDATSADCSNGDNGDGFHTIQSVSLQAGAQGWTAEYFADPTGANTPLTTTLTTYLPTTGMVSP